MTRPRQVVPGATVMVTRATHRREMWLVPGPEVNEAVLYCYAYAAERFEVDLCQITAMSTHLHTNAHDRSGRLSEATGWAHQYIAKCVNHIHGRTDSVFDCRRPAWTQAVTTEAEMALLAYSATNPIKDGAVRRLKEWPGVCTQPADWRRPITVHRPAYFDRDGLMPETIDLHLRPPPSLAHLPLEEAIEQAEAVIRAESSRLRHERKLAGKGYQGPRRCRAIPPGARPSSPRRRGIMPHFKACNPAALRRATARLKHFWRAHALARRAFAAGDREILFPAGTYLHRLRYGVRCHPFPPELLAHPPPL